MPDRMNNLYPAKVFYDGECPLCRREAAHFRTRDKTGQLQFVDIAATGFDARRYGLDPVRIHEVMHAQTADGRTHTELDAFRVIWRAMPRLSLAGVLLLIFALPGMNYLGGIAYRWFARNRYRLTGRCKDGACET